MAKISEQHIRQLPVDGCEVIYFDSFPNCIKVENRWSSSTGIPIVFSRVLGSKGSESVIQITFLDLLGGKVRQFLSDWQIGTYGDPVTGKKCSTADLKAEVRIQTTNKNEIMKLIIKFPNEFQIGLERPYLRAMHYQA